MTAPQADGADRFSRAAERPLRASAAAPALVILLLLGLVLRLTIAYVLWPGSGFETDLATYQFWAQRLHELGPGGFYAPDIFADYPPGYLYVMWLGGHVMAFLHGGNFAAISGDAIKLGPIVADVLLAAVLFVVVRRWASERRDADRLGLVAAGLYLFNPVTWYDSALWGQTDAAGALVVLLGVVALVRGNSEGAVILTVLAALVKPQFGVILAPLVAAVLIKRHLLTPGSGPRNSPWVPPRLRRWFAEEQGILRLVMSGVAGLVVLIVLLLPFNLTPFSFLERMAGTAGGYPWLSVNAYNPWALFGAGGEQPIAFVGARWSPDTVPFLGPVPAVAIGAVVLVGAFLAAMLRAGWKDDRRSIVVVAIFLALAFFVLPTRVHERYLFPVFALLPLLAVVDRRWLLVTIALAAGAMINFHGILTLPLYATPNLEGLPLGDAFRSAPFVALSALLATTGLAFAAWRMRRRAAVEPDPYEQADEWEALPVEDGPDDETARRPRPAYETAPGLLGPIRETLAPLFSSSPLRRDRSAELAGESGGRLDRLDLLLLVLVLLATLGLRTFRLDKPFGMHFDEVYHARTAMEFLQHWRYDMPHSIYEYTHPHLAKYVIAAGLVTLGDNRVVHEQALGFDARAAAVEQRWAPETTPGVRNGDRLFVAGENEVRVYDLADRRLEETIPVTADHLAVDDDGHGLYLADRSGRVWLLPTAALDTARSGPLIEGAAPEPRQLTTIAGLVGDVSWLGIAAGRVIVIAVDGTVVSLDPDTGEESGRVTIPGAAEAIRVGGGDHLALDVGAVSDVPSVAAVLADILETDAARFETLLAGRPGGSVVVGGYLTDEQAERVQASIDDESLRGAQISAGDAIALAGDSGVTFLDPTTLAELSAIDTSEPVTGVALVERGTDRPTIYAASGDVLEKIRLPEDGPPEHSQAVEMPNIVHDAIWNPTTALLHAPGVSQDGAAPTIYVVSPVSDSIFADARLGFEPAEIVLDAQPRRPADDRVDLLTLAPDGRLATVDAGNNAFAWRFPGVVAGALMAACIYLLARFLFNRRSVAVIASLLVLADGMFFANARIAMNDTYVSLFIVAAFTLFVPLWLGRWRGRVRVAAVLLAVGLLLGLALASKWVAAYAIGAVGLLILVRSAIGRLIALGGMVAATGLLGYLAITPAPEATDPQLNFLFLMLMLALTVGMAVLVVLRPVRMTLDELRFVVAWPLVLGLALLAAGGVLLASGAPVQPGASITPTRLLVGGGALCGLGAIAYLAARGAARFGRGPLAPPVPAEPGVEPAAPPPPRGWLRPGSGPLGLPWLAALAAITLIPVAVYVISFVPWIDLGNRWTTDFPAGNTGQTFLDLQVSMYEYHNYLRATHAASSPWWAWPLDLKPVWFYKEDFAHNTTAQIYDAGNLVVFWLSIPAVVFAGYQAWRRRSLPLTLIVVALACLWLPWARIDRVAFQYHIFTSLPFWFLALAYFMAELWHGPSARTWLLARVAGGMAVVGPALLWLLRVPLCAVGGTEQVNPGTEACGPLSRHLVLTDMQALGLGSAFVALILVGWIVWTQTDGRGSGLRTRPVILPLVFGLALGGAILALVGAAVPGTPVFERDVRAEEPALIALILLAVPAYFVLRARDARRFVIGIVAAAAGWFVLWYPNIAALPLPRTLAEVYQGFLPTWNYAFQFGSNQDAPNRSPIDYGAVGLLGLLTLLLVVAAIWAARAYRAERAERRVLRALREAG